MSLNNFLRDPDHPVADIALLSPLSNERLIFFMDSPYLASRTGPTWKVTDPRPSVIIGTLAHEFQHMIHFYQKPILRDGSSAAWLNEMASEVAEDLIADKLMIDGPRGVDYDDPTAGEPDNLRGRLPEYNFFNDIRVTSWEDDIANYSINYALGAYLARTYGAEVFSRIVQSDAYGVEAIEGALDGMGRDVSFGDIMANWAAATLLSDNTAAPAPYRYNSGTWSTSQRRRQRVPAGIDRPVQLRLGAAGRVAGGHRPESACGAWPSSGRTCTPCGPSTRARSRRTPTCTPPSGAPPGPSA